MAATTTKNWMLLKVSICNVTGQYFLYNIGAVLAIFVSLSLSLFFFGYSILLNLALNFFGCHLIRQYFQEVNTRQIQSNWIPLHPKLNIAKNTVKQ